MLDRLLIIQRRESLPDREMAERLSVARSTWTEIRNGNRRLSEAVTVRAVRAFPELLPGYVMSVSESEPTRGPQAARRTQTPAEPVA